MTPGGIRLTRLFKRNPGRLWQAPRIDRKHNSGGESKAVRHQTATGAEAQASATTGGSGSSSNVRLDPHSLPLRFEAHDARADGGVQRVELHRERVVLHRAVRGMRMAINVRVSDFLGIALRGVDDAQILVLVHRDPSLTIPLCVSSDADEIASAWQL